MIDLVATFTFPKHSVQPERPAKVLLARRAVFYGGVALFFLLFHEAKILGNDRPADGWFLDLLLSAAILTAVFGLFWLWYREQVNKSVRTAKQARQYQIESATIDDELLWTDSLGGLNEVKLTPASVTEGCGLLLVWWKDGSRATLTDVQAVFDLKALHEDARKALKAQLSRKRALC